MAAKIDWTEIALEDLGEVASRVGADNPERGIQYGDAIVDFVSALGTFPMMGRSVPEFANPVIREVILPPYRIVYRVSQDESMVVIARVWHAARGVPELPGNI